MIAIILIILSALSMPLYGYNHLALGEATVMDDNADAARVLAAKRSLRDIALRAGLSPSALKNLLIYINERSELAIDSSSESVPIKVNKIEELKYGNKIEVRATVEINEANLCLNNSKTRESVSIIPFEFDARASFVSQKPGGHLQDVFGRYVSILNRFKPRYKIEVDNAQEDLKKDNADNITRKQSARDLVQEITSDYILSAEIHDTSVRRLGATPETYKKLVRNFSISFVVFDGHSGYKLNEYHYKISTPWPYKYVFSPNHNMITIWETEYGVAVEEVLFTAIQDLSFFIECERNKF